MKQEKKLTKKASSRIYNVVIKFQPKASKLITYDEAWEVIANEGNLEGEVETKRNGDTKFILYKNDEIIHTYNLTGTFKPEIGDWDWTTIYKTVLEDVISRRLYKNAKKGKKKLEKPVSIEKPLSKKEEKVIDIEELKRLKFNLKMKIKNWTLKGKDTKELEKELSDIENKLKSNKKKPSKI